MNRITIPATAQGEQLTRISKAEAINRFNRSKGFYICPCKLNPRGPVSSAYHCGPAVIAEWIGKAIGTDNKATAWANMLANWTYYNLSSCLGKIGRYPAFYVAGPRKWSDCDEFTEAYLTTALWSTIGPNDEPLDNVYGLDDIHPNTIEQMAEDCAAFQRDNATALESSYSLKPYVEYGDNAYTAASAGHDFWLTRHHHGTGFWDRGLGKTGDQLTDAAHKWSEFDLWPLRGQIRHG